MKTDTIDPAAPRAGARTATAAAAPVPADAPRWLAPLGWASLASFAAVQVYALTALAPDRGMGDLQKIMYVHVPTAWGAMVAFLVVFVASVTYLVTKREKHDLVAAASAEVGVVLTALTLVLGSLWGRPTWGVWWTWDPRLTTTAILLMIYAGYLALRAFTDDPARRARWSAAVGILAFLNVPIVYMSVRWWRTIHQVQSSRRTMDPTYWWVLMASAVALLMVMTWMIARRYQAAKVERAVEARREEAALSGGEAYV